MRGPLLLIAVSAAVAQSDRNLTFSPTTALPERSETATVIRSIANPAGLETTSDGLIIRGSAEVVNLGAWLFERLEKRSARSEEAFTLGGEEVRLFAYHAGVTLPMLQEAAVALRTVLDANRLFVHGPARVIAIRAPAAQVESAAWLVRMMAGSGEQPMRRLPSGAENTIRFFALSFDRQPLQELATVVRSVLDVRRLMILPQSGQMVARGTPAQILAVEWLVPALMNRQASGHHLEGAAEPEIRLFDLSKTADRQAKATEIRKSTRIPRVFAMNTPPFLAVRGTAEQVAAVAKLIAQ